MFLGKKIPDDKLLSVFFSHIIRKEKISFTMHRFQNEDTVIFLTQGEGDMNWPDVRLTSFQKYMGGFVFMQPRCFRVQH